MNGRDEQFMTLAIAQAKKAALTGDVPVGAVCVLGNEVISVGRNRREYSGCASAHAEIEAIGLACRRLGGWQLWQCELYVTLEPCPMCAGAIVNARLKRVVFGASDPASLSLGGSSVSRVPSGRKPEVVAGVMEEQCSALLKDFFSQVREKPAVRAAATRRILLGSADIAETVRFTQECAVLAEGDGLLYYVENGKYSFPRLSLDGMSPRTALAEKMPWLSAAGKRLTVTRAEDGAVCDRIYYDCSVCGALPEGYEFSLRPPGLDESDAAALEEVQKNGRP